MELCKLLLLNESVWLPSLEHVLLRVLANHLLKHWAVPVNGRVVYFRPMPGEREPAYVANLLSANLGEISYPNLDARTDTNRQIRERVHSNIKPEPEKEVVCHVRVVWALLESLHPCRWSEAQL